MRLKNNGLSLIKCPEAVGYHWHPAFSVEELPELIDKEIQRARMGVVFYQKHPTLDVRLMIQMTWLHRLLWGSLSLGGLLNERSLGPTLRWLIDRGYPQLSQELSRVFLNWYNVNAVYAAYRDSAQVGNERAIQALTPGGLQNMADDAVQLFRMLIEAGATPGEDFSYDLETASAQISDRAFEQLKAAFPEVDWDSICEQIELDPAVPAEYLDTYLGTHFVEQMLTRIEQRLDQLAHGQAAWYLQQVLGGVEQRTHVSLYVLLQRRLSLAKQARLRGATPAVRRALLPVDDRSDRGRWGQPRRR